MLSSAHEKSQLNNQLALIKSITTVISELALGIATLH